MVNIFSDNRVANKIAYGLLSVNKHLNKVL